MDFLFCLQRARTGTEKFPAPALLLVEKLLLGSLRFADSLGQQRSGLGFQHGAHIILTGNAVEIYNGLAGGVRSLP